MNTTCIDIPRADATVAAAMSEIFGGLPTAEQRSALEGGGRIIRLKAGSDAKTVVSLIRYVEAFGQGIGVAEGGGTNWIIRVAHVEDEIMLRSQFGDLFAETAEA